MKYLLIVALGLQLTFADSNGEKTEVACEGGTINLECANGKVIYILSANYGRTSGVTCPIANIENQNCVSSSAYFLVSTSCNDKRTCSVIAINDIFGDNCYGTSKYVEVRYKCIKSNIQTAISCEGHPINLKCPIGQVLNIVKANYGRTDAVTCPGSQISNKNCYAIGTTTRVHRMCNNINSCLVSSNIFGDPCFGTQKYLDIQYDCVSVYGGSVTSCKDRDCIDKYCKNFVCNYDSGL